MKNRIAKVLGVLAVVGLLASLIPATIAQGASNAQDADGDGTAQVIPGRVGVLFNAGVTDPRATANEMARQHGFKVVHVFSSALKGFGAKDVPAGRIKALRNDPRVQLVALDRTVQASDHPGEVPNTIDRIDAEPGLPANTGTGGLLLAS